MRFITPFVTPRSLASDFWNDFDRVFDDVKFSTPAYDERLQFNAPTELVEAENHFWLSMDLPGMKKEDIKIEVQENTLSISGERKREGQANQNKNVHRLEKYYGTFKRSYALPTLVDVEKIEAQYQDGVLELYIPKAQSAQPRRIEIQSGKTGLFDKLLNVKKTESKDVTTQQ